ncbi:MAG: hypothetical protein AAB475_01990 [Patescibacteria group bacterium]
MTQQNPLARQNQQTKIEWLKGRKLSENVKKLIDEMRKEWNILALGF